MYNIMIWYLYMLWNQFNGMTHHVPWIRSCWNKFMFYVLCKRTWLTKWLKMLQMFKSRHKHMALLLTLCIVLLKHKLRHVKIFKGLSEQKSIWFGKWLEALSRGWGGDVQKEGGRKASSWLMAAAWGPGGRVRLFALSVLIHNLEAFIYL